MAKLKVVKVANQAASSKLIKLIKNHHPENVISDFDPIPTKFGVVLYDDSTFFLTSYLFDSQVAQPITSNDLEALSLVSGEVFTELLFSL